MTELEPQRAALPGEPEHRPERVPWELRDIVFAGLATVALLIAGVVALVAVLAVAGAALNWQLGLSDPIPSVLVFAVFALEAVLVVPVWIFGPGKYRTGWRSLGFRDASWPQALGLVAISFVLVLAINAGWSALQRAFDLPGQPEVLPLFGGGIAGLLLALLAGGVVAPFAEEIFFRGFLFAGLRKRWGVTLGMVISSLIFAVLHLPPAVMPPIFVMGLLFAALYQLTGSLWPPILLHSLVNSLAFVGAYIVERNPSLAPGLLFWWGG